MSSLCLFLLSFFRTFDHKGLDWFEPNPCDSVAMFWTIKWIFENPWKCINCQCRIIPNLKESASFLDTLINSLSLALLITVGNWKDRATWNMWFPRSGSSRWQEVVGGDVQYKLPREQGELIWVTGIVIGSIIFLPQTHLIKPGTKMLTLLPGERKCDISFTQRRSTRQTSIASFVTLQPGMVTRPGIFHYLRSRTSVFISPCWTFMNCRCCSGKGIYYTCFLYMCFAGSVLLRLILNICIYQQSSEEGHTWELRAGLNIQSQVEGVGPLLRVTLTLACYSGLYCINRMCTIPPPHKTLLIYVTRKASSITPKSTFPSYKILCILYIVEF